MTCIIEIGENNNEVGYSTKTENRIIVGFKIMNKYREDAEDDDGCENYSINFNKGSKGYIYSQHSVYLFVANYVCLSSHMQDLDIWSNI